MRVEFTLNGASVSTEVDPMARLLDVVREQFDLPGTKEGCGEGECGACSVLLDDQPVLSCLVPIGQCAERQVVTVEGLGKEAEDFLGRFVAAGGVQCGACTPGIVVTAWALLRRTAHPSREDIQEWLAGNLCRCTGYEGIYRAFDAD